MSETTTFRDIILVEEVDNHDGADQDESALVWHRDYFGALKDFKQNYSSNKIARHQQPCDAVCQRMQRYWQQFGFMTSTCTLTRFQIWYKDHVCVVVDDHRDANQKNLVL